MRETIFVWDSVNDCVMSELDGSGAVQVSYTNEPQPYGGVISQRRGTTTSTYHADALGSTRALTDNSGNVTDTYLNDAWGNSVASTGTTVNPFRWVGKYGYYTDNSTGQIYVRARMYQPIHARWGSIDPLAVRTIDKRVSTRVRNLLRHLMLFGSYAFNKPESQLDPSGLATCKVKICSSPVPNTRNLGGHLFVICDGEAMRAGPNPPRDEMEYPEILGAVGCKCEMANKDNPYGRLISTVAPWGPDFVDHPEAGGYPVEELNCRESVVDGACNDVCGCLRERFLALWKCCIVYDPFPDLRVGDGDADGNSNSAVIWAWTGCIAPSNPLKTNPPVPSDGRIEPGQLQGVPRCIERAAPSRIPLFAF